MTIGAAGERVPAVINQLSPDGVGMARWSPFPFDDVALRSSAHFLDT